MWTLFTPFSTVSFADFKQGNVYWDSFFWLWYNIHLMHNKILHRFFSNNKALLSRTSFANLHVRIFKKEANFLLLFEYGYMRSNLGRSGGYLTHRDVADMSNLFYFHFEFIWSRGMTRLPSSRLSKRNRLNKNRYKHFSLARRKLYKCVYTI